MIAIPLCALMVLLFLGVIIKLCRQRKIAKAASKSSIMLLVPTWNVPGRSPTWRLAASLADELRKSGARVVFNLWEKNDCDGNPTDWLVRNIPACNHILFVESVNDVNDNSLPAAPSDPYSLAQQIVAEAKLLTLSKGTGVSVASFGEKAKFRPMVNVKYFKLMGDVGRLYKHLTGVRVPGHVHKRLVECYRTISSPLLPKGLESEAFSYTSEVV